MGFSFQGHVKQGMSMNRVKFLLNFSRQFFNLNHDLRIFIILVYVLELRLLKQLLSKWVDIHSKNRFAFSLMVPYVLILEICISLENPGCIVSILKPFQMERQVGCYDVGKFKFVNSRQLSNVTNLNFPTHTVILPD